MLKQIGTLVFLPRRVALAWVKTLGIYPLELREVSSERERRSRLGETV